MALWGNGRPDRFKICCPEMGVRVRLSLELQVLIILTMDLQELKYLLDYAKRHNMMHQSFISVYQAWSNELENAYSM